MTLLLLILVILILGRVMWFRRRRPLSTEEKVARIIARNQAHAAWLCFMRRVADGFMSSEIA